MTLTIIDIAKLKMMHSKDPIHDYDHVARVVSLCNQIGTDMNISESDAKTLEIAAWWHDTARTITSGSSFIFLSLFDDLLSASLLLFHAARTKNLSTIVVKAALILISKTLFLSPFFSLLTKKSRKKLLLDILEDADNLDMISRERSASVMQLVKDKPRYKLGYKVAISWFLSKHLLTFKTKKSKEILVLYVEEFLEWVYEPETMKWHSELFSQHWIEGKLQEATIIITQLKKELTIA